MVYRARNQTLVETVCTSLRGVLIIEPVKTLGTGTAQLYTTGLRGGWSGVRAPAGGENFSLHNRVQTGSGFHPASYPMGTRGCFPGGKAVGVWSRQLSSI
jgi:hypothetical protein